MSFNNWYLFTAVLGLMGMAACLMKISSLYLKLDIAAFRVAELKQCIHRWVNKRSWPLAMEDNPCKPTGKDVNNES